MLLTLIITSLFIVYRKILKIILLFKKAKSNILTKSRNLLKELAYYYFFDYSNFARDLDYYNSIEFVNSKFNYENNSFSKQFEILIYFNFIARFEAFLNNYHIDSNFYDNNFFLKSFIMSRFTFVFYNIFSNIIDITIEK